MFVLHLCIFPQRLKHDYVHRALNSWTRWAGSEGQTKAEQEPFHDGSRQDTFPEGAESHVWLAGDSTQGNLLKTYSIDTMTTD